MAATGFVLSTAACASQQQMVGQKDDLLAANEAQMTAIMNQEAWDWGPWGP